MQLFLYAVGCWLTFLAVDSLFFVFSSLKDVRTFSLTFVPDTFTIVFIVLCYTCIGFSIGLFLKCFEGIGKKYLPAKNHSWPCLAVIVSLGCNCIMNSVLLYKNNILKIPFLSAVYSKAFLLFIVILLGIWLAVTCANMIRKGPLTALMAFCVSGELFWGILREGLFPGGSLKDSFAGYGGGIITAVAVAVSGLVFTSLYFYVPRLFARSGRKSAFLFLASGVFLSAGIFDASFAGQPAAALRRPNIVLILLDTVRADHLSCYGYPQKTTPVLDAFAAHAVRYSRAYSTASYTLPSIATIVTGLYPCGHNANRLKESDNRGDASLLHWVYEQDLNDNQTTLAEFLKKTGYATAGIISNNYLTRHFGFDQGFDYYDDDIPSVAVVMQTCAALPFLNMFLPIDDYLTAQGHNGQRIAAQINASAIDWLSRYDTKAPFFLMLHYFDAHNPYFPEKTGMQNVPDAIKKRYAKTANYIDLEKQIISPVIQGQKILLPDEKDFLINNYDRELLLLDSKLGELFSYLQGKNLYDESLIIVASDHGESFGEHNLMLHGICLYEDNLHVPLLIKYPKSEQKTGTVDYPVSLAGLVPTILSYLAIDMPDFIQGASFADPQKQILFAMNIQNSFSPWVLPELFTADTYSLIKNGYQLIRFDKRNDQLYYLNNDPHETIDIIAQESATGAGLGAALEQCIKQFTNRRPAESVPQSVDKKTIENLRNLGYIK